MEENRTPHDEEPRNPHVHYEPGDVNAIFLTKFGIGMALMITVFLFMLAGLFSYLKAREAKLARVPAPVARPQALPPEPRLQADPAVDMRRMRADEERLLHQYAWIDPDKGIVRIPVERAMELMAQGKTR
jgi:hypothetical protein